MTKGKGDLFLHKGCKKLCLLDLLYREGYVQSVGLRNGRQAYLLLNKGNSFNTSFSFILQNKGDTIPKSNLEYSFEYPMK